jgi:hypothetical protein
VTVISLRVSVPVLSVQMTVVLPRVSTADSRRTITCRPTMRETPNARVTVIMAGRPSGIAPTASATAAVSISAAPWPRSRPIAKVTAARPRIATVTSLLKCSILRVSGVRTPSASPTSRLIRPSSVPAPVATTTPRPPP